ncbi:exo-alpha-sialidase [Roseinatronobacter monicus]|uniref:BNR/Asp-box repeat protein n=1 Tax=Roseinatronobacter monicus TaxID=393481 RepID=A0A543KD94_9RHOB|nr:exo-alpha-sialidase [Roseinatronobacter monicus]TQM93056.1 hypothetical protein BD293_1679 [Roseinatronobacter monicus]
MSRTVLVGTTKGAFMLHQQPDGAFTVSGPHCDGWPINHVIGDSASGHIWAAGGGEWFGAGIWHSVDGGATWTLTRLTGGQMDDWAENDADFAAMIGWQKQDFPFEAEFSQIWSLHHSNNRLYAGTKPADLLVSHDNGTTFARVSGLGANPSRDEWQPGAAGLILHSIASDQSTPEKLWVGISAAGIFATEDGGATWDRRNRLSNTESCVHYHHPAAPSGGETGHCVHNLVRAPQGDGDLLYQQNHHGVWRSPDGGRSWEDKTEGLPSSFGFPIAVHPQDPQKIWVIPLNGDMEGRFPPDAKAAVWHSTDGGESWQDQREGLPQSSCFFTVLRQAMATDKADPAGIYFGTNSGSVFASFDEGALWHEIARHLPTIQSVEIL